MKKFWTILFLFFYIDAALAQYYPPSGGGTPGGSNGQVQYNNNGAFGGLTNTQLTADINLFSTSATTSGAVPGSNSAGAGYFLQADQTWAIPAGTTYSANNGITLTGSTFGLSGIAQNTVLGSVASGSNTPIGLTATQLTTIPNLATDLLKGSLPALTDAQIVIGKTSSAVQAVAMSGDVTITNAGVTSIKSSVALAGSPTTTTQSSSDNSTKIATTAYVTTGISNAIAGVNPAIAVQAASAAKLPNSPAYVAGVITSGTNSALVLDGYTVLLGDRVLVKNEGDAGGLGAADNGIYTETQLGVSGVTPWILTRASDYNTPSNINSTGAIPVVNGTVNATTSWLLTSKVTTIGTDPLTYEIFTLAPTTIITSASAPTQYGVVLGQGSQVVTSTAAGTQYYPLVANSASNPTFQQLTAAGIASGTITTTQISSTAAITGSQLSSSAAIASTQLANTAVTAGSYINTNLTVNAEGQITAASNGSSGFAKYSLISESSNFNVTATSGNFYMASATCTATLPATPADGTVLKFYISSGTLTLTANASDTIVNGSTTTATGGSLTLAAGAGVIELIAVSGGWIVT